MTKRPDKWNGFAAEKYGVPQGWRWASLDCSKDAAPYGWVKVEGAVFVVHPDGLTTWNDRDRRTERVLFMNLDELEAWEQTKALEEGRCWRCWGNGQVSVSFSVKTGHTYQTCPDCRGSGKPYERGAVVASAPVAG